MRGQYSGEVDKAKGADSRWKPLYIWGIGVLAALVVLQTYYGREMLAAFFIFTILFVVVAVVVGIIYAIGRVGEAGVVFAEPVARRGLVLAEELSKKTFHRPRSEPVP